MKIEDIIYPISRLCYIYYENNRIVHHNIFSQEVQLAIQFVMTKLYGEYQNVYGDFDVISVSVLDHSYMVMNNDEDLLSYFADMESSLANTICNGREDIIYVNVCPFDGYVITRRMIIDLFDSCLL